jgi:glycosyltransferase involved in cell wall biosynthesis
MAGFPEMVEDGVNGLLFVPGDAADLAAKIRVLWEDKSLCRRMGENGYQQLKSHYSPEACYRKLMEVYREVREMRNVKCEM